MNLRILKLGALCAVALLASCSSSKDEGPGDERSRGGPPEGGGSGQMMGPQEIPENAQTYEGVFTMENGIFPALVDNEGDTWYLLMEFPFTEDMLPKEGRDILVKAIPSEDYPERITVLYLEVEGDMVEPEMPERPRGAQGRPQGGSPGN